MTEKKINYQEYNQKRDVLKEKYAAKLAPHLREYEEACAPYMGEYQVKTAAFLGAYEAARDPIASEYARDVATLIEYCQKNRLAWDTVEEKIDEDFREKKELLGQQTSALWDVYHKADAAATEIHGSTQKEVSALVKAYYDERNAARDAAREAIAREWSALENATEEQLDDTSNI